MGAPDARPDDPAWCHGAGDGRCGGCDRHRLGHSGGDHRRRGSRPRRSTSAWDQPCSSPRLSVAGAVTFAAVGALGSQLAPTRRQAAAWSGVALGSPTRCAWWRTPRSGLAWMRWATPLGWVGVRAAHASASMGVRQSDHAGGRGGRVGPVDGWAPRRRSRHLPRQGRPSAAPACSVAPPASPSGSPGPRRWDGWRGSGRPACSWG